MFKVNTISYKTVEFTKIPPSLSWMSAESVLLERLPDERHPGLVRLSQRRPLVHAELLSAEAGDPHVPVALWGGGGGVKI